MDIDDEMGETGEPGEFAGDTFPSDLLETGWSEGPPEWLDLEELGRGWGKAEYEPREGFRRVRITVPVDSADESEVSEVLLMIGGIGSGMTLKSWVCRCDPSASSLRGTLGSITMSSDSTMASSIWCDAGSVLGPTSMRRRGCEVDEGGFCTGDDLGIGRDRVFSLSRPAAISFSLPLRILNGAVAGISCSGAIFGP